MIKGMNQGKWSEEEKQFLLNHESYPSWFIAELMKKKGWNRTDKAISSYKHRLECEGAVRNSPLGRILARQEKLKKGGS